MALDLYSPVCSVAGRRSVPPSSVPTAIGSYGAHASYMAVCTTARARATTVGPGLVARIAASVASSQRSTTSSVGDGGYWSKFSDDALPGGLPGLGGGGLTAASAANCEPATTVPATTAIRMVTRARDVFFDIGPTPRHTRPDGAGRQTISTSRDA